MSAAVPLCQVHFTHLACELTDEELTRYGSPHVNRKEVGQELLPRLQQRAGVPIREFDCTFQRSQILCANEVFPEAVSADPLADLEIWDEWQQNIRRFPFPGLFSPLGIAGQKGKTTSSTSVGVLGEIMTGLFSQAYISPWVIVRPIRRWPDFIYFCSDERYAFVECKAFTGVPFIAGNPWSRIPRAILQDCINDAVNQLNADPFVTVWFAFTEICLISQLELSVTFLEFNAPDQRRRDTSRRFLPRAVVQGLAERAVSSGAASAMQHEGLFEDVAISGKAERGRIRKSIEATSMDEIPQVLHRAVPESLRKEAAEDVAAQARKLAAKVKPSLNDQGKRLKAAKELAMEGQIAELRSFGSDTLYLVDLTLEQRKLLERDWQPNWAQATEKWKTITNTDFWRCSTAAVGLGPQGLHGNPA